MAKKTKPAKGTKVAKAKKKCCKEDLRCLKCPVVLLRLSKMGYADRDTKRGYEVERSVPKKALLLARQR